MTNLATPSKHDSSAWYIASLIVFIKPGHQQTATSAISRLANIEVHASEPEGKVIITAEATTLQQMMASIEAVRAIPAVLSAQLVYQQVDDD